MIASFPDTSRFARILPRHRFMETLRTHLVRGKCLFSLNVARVVSVFGAKTILNSFDKGKICVRFTEVSPVSPSDVKAMCKCVVRSF